MQMKWAKERMVGRWFVISSKKIFLQVSKPKSYDMKKFMAWIGLDGITVLHLVDFNNGVESTSGLIQEL
jgi:hypothetical protein